MEYRVSVSVTVPAYSLSGATGAIERAINKMSKDEDLGITIESVSVYKKA